MQQNKSTIESRCEEKSGERKVKKTESNVKTAETKMKHSEESAAGVKKNKKSGRK